MKHVERIKVRIRKTEEAAMFYSNRADIRTLCKAINILIDKVNELVEANNEGYKSALQSNPQKGEVK